MTWNVAPRQGFRNQSDARQYEYRGRDVVFCQAKDMMPEEVEIGIHRLDHHAKHDKLRRRANTAWSQWLLIMIVKAPLLKKSPDISVWS